MSQYSEFTKTYPATEAIAVYRRVTVGSSGVSLAGAGEIGDGYALNAASASGDHVTVKLDTCSGTVNAVLAGAAAAGVDLFCAASGKLSATPAGPVVAKALEAATADGDIIEVMPVLKRVEWLGKTFEAIADNKTLDAQDVGKVFYVTADAKTITLPATAAGLGPITIMNGAADGTVAVNVSPDADDKIMGANIAGTNNKDLVNTKATAVRGDLITISPDVAGNGWQVHEIIGTWATEA